MSTPTPPPKAPKRVPKDYIFNSKHFNSANALINHLISLNLLTIKDRVIICQYCGATLHPVNEAAHYFSKHRDKLQFSK